MPFVQECSDFSIRNNQITVVEGCQYNTTHIIHNNQVRVVRQPERRQSTIWHRFRRIRIGDVSIIEDVGSDDEEKLDRSGLKTVTRRTMSIARVYGSNADTKFLCARYSGPGAFKAFKQDFDTFSAINCGSLPNLQFRCYILIIIVRHPKVAQLFGYNDQSNLPMLVFYDALIPLGRVLSARNQLTLILEIYFRLQIGVEKISDYLYETIVRSFQFDSYLTPSLDGGSLQNAYSATDTVIDYLVRVLQTDTILESISKQFKSHSEQQTAVKAWPCLAGSLWRRNQRVVIARWTGLAKMTQYVCGFSYPSAMDERKVIMEDGSIRFEFADCTGFKDRWWLSYDLFHGGRKLDIQKTWLVQAHSVFSQLGIHEEEWEEYCISDRFHLHFYHTEEDTCRQVIANTTSGNRPVYLFIRPIPRPSDNGAIWRSWAESEKYFWSFDPSGRERMSEGTRLSLGLPCFATEVKYHHSCDLAIYKVIEKIQLFHGFDPKTTDFARSLGYPLLWHDDQFQELEDLASEFTDILELYDNGDCTSKEESESDEEIVLYPRSNRATVV
uniref:Uncharacterized protein n=1 Tax=Moniliophthora roreri TaxID=221103 RepID=A0A0W0FLK2_MONRR